MLFFIKPRLRPSAPDDLALQNDLLDVHLDVHKYKVCPQTFPDLATVGKTHGAAELLATASENHKLCKEYLAVVRGVPAQAEGELKDYLARNDALRKTVTVDKSFRGAKEARLSYRVEETKETAEGALTLVQIRLHTGRNHQIRVQFSSRGLPIVGDERYGSGGEQMALWAFRLTFPNPCGGSKTVMKLPSGGVWDQFSFENVR